VTRHVPALVVGGGISGLVCAYALRKSGIAAEIVEASPRPGGAIQSIRRDGFLLELGPQSFSSASALMDLCHELGLDNQILPAPRAPRLVLLDGALEPAPLSPPAFFTSSFFAMKTKWSVLRDVFGRSVPPANEESVGAFVRRKFTTELLERLVGPFVSGIYAGDPEKLSLRAAFPQLYDAESQAGSIVRGLVRLGKPIKQTERSRRTVFSFRDGNETLVHTLAARIGPALRTNVQATRIVRREDASLDVQFESGGQPETISAKALILATPTEVTGKLLSGQDSSLESLLKSIAYAPVAVVSLGYRRSEIRHPLDGFGFLVPRSAGLRVLGTVWNSSLFSGRIPDGHVLMTSFVGGVTDPAAVELRPAELANLVHSQTAPLLSATGNPVFSQVTVWPRAIPQYNLGHLDRMAAVRKLLKNCPGIWLTGNYLGGPAVGSCVEQAIAVAEEVRNALQSSGPMTSSGSGTMPYIGSGEEEAT
jgi:oxygen-dependent protoporphyrinogen oxidase